jgi:hypothetical protein
MHSAVQTEVSHLNAKQKRGGPSRLVAAANDKDDIFECYRRIESHFRQLQVSAYKVNNV